MRIEMDAWKMTGNSRDMKGSHFLAFSAGRKAGTGLNK